jgi:hypothetical protein
MLPFTVSPPLQARTINCVPDEGCPKDEGPPSCCQPPPCEFVQQLKFARAYRDSVKASALGFSFVSNTNATGMAAEMPWAGEIFQAFSDLLDQASPCPDNRFFEDPPILTADQEDQCEIMIWQDFDREYGSPSLEDLHDGVNSCEELVEAEYKKAQAKREICLAELYRTDPRTLHERMMQDLAVADAEVDELEAHMRRYEAACTVAPDSQAAQQAVEDDLAPLLPDEDELAPLLPDPKPKAKKKKAKRSGKKAGRK